MEKAKTAKRLVSLIVATAMVLALSALAPLPAAAAGNPFTDVNETDWYYRDVMYAYEAGLINGKTATLFAPGDRLTYAEAAKLAACMHELYTTGAIALTVGGGAWYESYVEYARANGIISKEYEWGEAASRAGYMEIFANALPDEALAPVNAVDDGAIPDVPATHPQAWEIYKLYRAGIVQGSDAARNCRPEASITRAEVAAILRRMMDASARASFTLQSDGGDLDLTPDAGTAEVYEPSNFFVAVSAGGKHSMAIKKDGSLWAWGNNDAGQLGDGTTENRLTPVKIMDGKGGKVVQVSTGYWHTMAIKEDGSLWGWGANSFGRLGDGTTENRLKPVKIMDGVAQVSAGSSHTMAVKTDGSLWAWGSNQYGQLGDGTRDNRLNPVKIMDGVTQVSAGSMYTIAIKKSIEKTDEKIEGGSLWIWGADGNGDLLVDGTGEARFKPIEIEDTDDVTQVSAGALVPKVIKTDGSLWHLSGKIYGFIYTPKKIVDNVVQVSASTGHTLLIKSDGSLWGWGSNEYGQVGIGGGNNVFDIVHIMDDVVQVSAGYHHTLAIKTDGSIWAWGRNWDGQLGDGTKHNKSNPVKITFPPAPYEVKIESQGTGAWGDGRYEEGETVNIRAGTPPDGYQFVKWTSWWGGFADAKSPETSFVMPKYSITLTAVFEPILDKEPTPEAKIDYINERLTNLVSGGTYSFNDGANETLTGTSRAIEESWFGTTVSIVKISDGTTPADSAAQSLEIPKRPAAPTLGKTDCTTEQNYDGTITGVNWAMEYQKSSYAHWIDVTMSPLTGATPGTYNVRVKAVEGQSFAGQIATVTIAAFEPVSPDKESTPEAAIDYMGEKLTNLVVGGTYSFNDGGDETLPGTSRDIDEVWFGTTVSIVKIGDGTATTDSAAQKISIPSRPAAPAVGKTDCTTSQNNDGALTGVSPAMEYQKSGDTDWKAITGTTVTGLANGTYNVRVKAVQGQSFAGQIATVTIASYMAKTYEVKISSEGTGASGGGSYEKGDTVNIGAGTPPKDKQFKEWTASPKVAFADAEKPNTSFEMPEADVTVTAVFEAIQKDTPQKEPTPAATVDYVGEKLTNLVSGGTYSFNDGADETLSGTSRAIDESWFGTTVSIVKIGDGTATTDSAAQSLAVKGRPAAPAVGKTDCTTDKNNDGTLTGVSPAMEYQKSGDAAWKAITGTTVTGLANGTYNVRVKAVQGQSFKSQNTVVTIAAYMSKTYEVKIASEGSGASGGGSYEKGDTVNISAGTPPKDKQFKNWTASPGVAFADAKKANTSFKMPEADVTVTAVFEAIQKDTPQKEPTPAATIDYINERLTNLASGGTYSFNGAGETLSGTSRAIDENWFGTTVSIVKIGKDAASDSAAQSLKIPSRPAAPAVGKTDCTTAQNNDGALTGVSSAMEYQKSGDAAWKAIAGTNVTGLANGTYSVRVKAVQGQSFAGRSATVTIAAYNDPDPDPDPAPTPAKNPFSDLKESDWYYGNVMYAYGLGLINGKSATAFAPNDNLTYAEAVKLAACMHELHTTGEVTLSVGGGAWYDSYVDYAKKNKIIAKDYDWAKAATRAGYMEIFANALPDEALAAVNGVDDGAIPDVPANHPQAWAIYRLYRAGILQGVDAAHNCRPDSNIRRSEVAAILTRMMDESARVRFTLQAKAPDQEPTQKLTGRYELVSMTFEGKTTTMADFVRDARDYYESMGQPFDASQYEAYIEFADGSRCRVVMFGESEEGTYRLDGKTLEITLAGETLEMTLEGSRVTLAFDNGDMYIFEKK